MSCTLEHKDNYNNFTGITSQSVAEFFNDNKMLVFFSLVTGFRYNECTSEFLMLFIGNLLFFLYRLGKGGTNIDTKLSLNFSDMIFLIFNDRAIIQFEFWLTFSRLMPVDNTFHYWPTFSHIIFMQNDKVLVIFLSTIFDIWFNLFLYSLSFLSFLTQNIFVFVKRLVLVSGGIALYLGQPWFSVWKICLFIACLGKHLLCRAISLEWKRSKDS